MTRVLAAGWAVLAMACGERAATAPGPGAHRDDARPAPTVDAARPLREAPADRIEVTIKALGVT